MGETWTIEYIGIDEEAVRRQISEAAALRLPTKHYTNCYGDRIDEDVATGVRLTRHQRGGMSVSVRGDRLNLTADDVRQAIVRLGGEMHVDGSVTVGDATLRLRQGSTITETGTTQAPGAPNRSKRRNSKGSPGKRRAGPWRGA